MTTRSPVRAWVLPAVVAVPLSLGATLSARADALAETAQTIETLIEEGRGDDAVAAARELMRQVTDAVGFGVTNVRLITAPATGFGVFEPRSSNSYLPGDPVYAYVEVYGFTLTPLADGANQMMFNVAFTLDAPDGRQMTESLVSMGEIRLESYSQPLDGYFHLTYRVTGAEGAFNLRTVVTDTVSGQVAEFTIPVVFEVPTAPAAEADK